MTEPTKTSTVRPQKPTVAHLGSRSEPGSPTHMAASLRAFADKLEAGVYQAYAIALVSTQEDVADTIAWENEEGVFQSHLAGVAHKLAADVTAEAFGPEPA